MGRRAEKALERINSEKIWTNVIGGDNSIFMDLGLSHLSAWDIGGFCCGFSYEVHAVEEMTPRKTWRVSCTTKTVKLIILVFQKTQLI